MARHEVFIREGDRVFRTYFINNRGDEAMGSTWSYLDLTALGRQEEWEDSPEDYCERPAPRTVDGHRAKHLGGGNVIEHAPRVQAPSRAFPRSSRSEHRVNRPRSF